MAYTDRKLKRRGTQSKQICPNPQPMPTPMPHPSFISAPASYLREYQKNSQQEVRMSPQTFLRLAVPKLAFSQESLDKLKQRMVSNQEIDPPYLDVDIDSGEILSHEGRHRSQAAIELGITEMPVILYFKRKNKETGRYYYVNLSKEKKIPTVSSLKPEKAGW